MVKIKNKANHICYPPLSITFIPGAWGAVAVAVNQSRRGAVAPCRSSNPLTAPLTFPWGQEVTWKLIIPVHGIALTTLWGPPARRMAAMDAQKTTGCNMLAGHPGSTLPAPAWQLLPLSFCRGRGTQTLLLASVLRALFYIAYISSHCLYYFWLMMSAWLSKDMLM